VLLQEIVKADGKEFHVDTMNTFYLGHVFKQIYTQNDLPLEEIAKLEIPFSPIFNEIRRYTGSPMALNRVLQKTPSLFAELVSMRYKTDDRKKQKKKYTDTQIQVAVSVLESWNLLPGLMTDGSINEDVLRNWIKEAQSRCAETHHMN
jgi:hypothetical protein